jgi:hypothetical protein
MAGRFPDEDHMEAAARDAESKGQVKQMNTNTYQGTAKIYQFPLRPRTAVAGHCESTNAAELMAQRISDAVETCWYHDAAIKQTSGFTKP